MAHDPKLNQMIAFLRRARAVTAVVFDCDGVLTDGQVLVGPGGGEQIAFSVQDGSGLTWLRRAGLRLGVVSGRETTALEARARQVGIEVVLQGVKDKRAVFGDLCAALACGADEMCYVGDDLLDLPLVRRVRLGVAVANARPELKAAAHYVTRAAGGRGAVREVAELVLRARGLWQGITAKYR